MPEKSISPNLKQLTLVNGSVIAGFQGPPPAKSLTLKVNGALTPFQKMSDTTFLKDNYVAQTRPNHLKIAKGIQSDPPQTKPNDRFTAWVNTLPAWALSGKDTLQIKIAQKEQPCTLHLLQELEVPASQHQLTLFAYLAGHRARARLIVTVLDRATGSRDQNLIDLDPKHTGGQLASGFQHVEVPLTPGDQGHLVSLSVEYLEYVSPTSDNEPFIFLADIRIASTLSDAQVLTPLHVVTQQAASGLNWVQAALPVMPQANDLIEVQIKGAGKTEAISVSRVPSTTFKVRENYGHTLIVEATSPSVAVLCVDGTAVSRLEISQGDTAVRIPSRFLTGVARHISLKDETGSFIAYENQQTLPSVLTPAEVIQRETPAPFLNTLFAQTPLRYSALKAQIAHAGPKTDLSQISYALSVLEGGYDKVKLKPLQFPAVEKPDVSIIIPAHNKVEVTYLALCSLLVAYNKASFEVIVVDDCSTDETTELENIVAGISVIHNSEAQRFIRSCNAGAEAARGDYVVLLNNDVEVTTGWLDELLGTFDRFDNVGLAGSKLLYPTGELQDAGGIIWGTGNPWNYGNRQNAMAPKYSYARQADYLSGAAMMVPATLWRELGGLSSYLEPMYFEDTDFAFKVREAGYKTWFVPSSVVYHFEGMTSGTNVSKGFKRYQEVNRPKFKRRWVNAYSGFGKEGHAPDLEKDRGIVGRVLFIDYATPRPDQDAGSYAALQEMQMVQSLGYKVSFLPTNMAHMGSYTENLQKRGIEAIYSPFHMSLTEYLNKHATDFDAVYITRYYVAEAVLERIRLLSPTTKILFNNADLHFLREIRAARNSGDTSQMEQAAETRTRELAVIEKVDLVLSYNEMEHSVIEACTEGRAKIVKCPWVVSTPANVPDLKNRAGLSFLGGFSHKPNAEGIKWFANDVMPLLSKQKKAPKLTIYGSKMGPEIEALRTDFIDPVGFVDEVTDAFDSHRIFVAPLLSGAGIKGKVLSALAHGIPIILTPIAAEAIGLRSGHDCIIVSKPEDWVEAITRLNTDNKLWQTLSDNALAFVKDNYSFEIGKQRMREAFEAADLYTPVR